jgi:hypothetical protein
MAFETTLKLYLYLYGKYSTQTMIFWSICAFIWFRNMKKMLLQMTSASLQPQPVPSLLSRAKNSGSQCHFKIWLDCHKLKNVPCLIMPMSPKCQKKIINRCELCNVIQHDDRLCYDIFCSTLSEFENFLLCERILINVTITCQNETSN